MFISRCGVDQRYKHHRNDLVYVIMLDRKGSTSKATPLKIYRVINFNTKVDLIHLALHGRRYLCKQLYFTSNCAVTCFF